MFNENKAVKCIEFIKDNYCEEEDSSFCEGLLALRGYTNYEELDSEFLSCLMDMLQKVKKGSHRAAIIEIIVEIEDFDFNQNKELLDEYIFLLSQKATTKYKAVRCLSDFACSGAEEEEVYSKIIKYLSQKDAIEILVKINGIRRKMEKMSRIPKAFSERINMLGKIRYRTEIVSTFLSIVHPLCSKYAEIGKTSFGYPCVEAAVLDWAWKKPGSANHLAKEGMFTVKETEILEKLGGLLSDMLRKYSNDIKLDSDEIRALYYEFFNNRNPLDVMFTLP
ncbi:hypothetical protein [Clostridium beijerinckii]|uniref:hypothetical protein n=1 Tax=Clostridium beijerinckii TaxID=1520 RepID=UPI001494B027|nr:hypothetical protein [Clostridium beijerinckii]NOW04343.1 hypothetical protein [Clostridium beijerinckii]NYC02516.1 hypothetical protein [Clostridium beijerinckii]